VAVGTFDDTDAGVAQLSDDEQGVVGRAIVGHYDLIVGT
jgi:hypothetical protein